MIMEIPGRVVKPWRCNTSAESGASTPPATTSAGQEKYLPATKPESAPSVTRIKIELMDPPCPPMKDWNHSWANHGALPAESDLGEECSALLHVGDYHIA